MSAAADFSQVLDAKLGRLDPPPTASWTRPGACPDPGLRFALWGGGVYASGPRHAYQRAARVWADTAAAEAPRGCSTAGATGSWCGDSDAPPPDNPARRSAQPNQAPAGESASHPRRDREPLRRHLSLRQKAALATLQRCGATDLDATSSRSDVKRAFRALALRYHPDRHLDAPPAERARMGARFAEASQAYRTLIGA